MSQHQLAGLEHIIPLEYVGQNELKQMNEIELKQMNEIKQ